jgi:tetratricopeptide (TPR) repeat protein
MWRQHPWTGVGLDRYGAYFRSVRPQQAAVASDYSDAAHSVPLHLLATGGLVVTVPYVVLVGLLAWMLLGQLRALEGEPRLVAGAVGGAWIAYQVQSLVSIDQPGLAVTGWLLAGAVAAGAANMRGRELLLPGGKVTPTKSRRRAVPVTDTQAWTGATYLAMGVVVVGGVLLAWLALVPLRASHASRQAMIALSRGDGNAALTDLDRATQRAGYEPVYWLRRGRFLQEVHQPALALKDYREGLRRDPRAYDLALALATLGAKQHDDSAVRTAEAVLERVDRSGLWRQAVQLG